jgi:hypothetical protein
MPGMQDTDHQSTGGCSVDADLFDSLEEAVAFVAERGGGTVYTELVGSLLAELIAVPASVTLAPPRDARPKRRSWQPPED